jgi:hypothetical protein
VYKKIVITIDRMGNAAFDDGFDGRLETARILSEATEKIKNGGEPESLLDLNGNKVGNIKYTENRGGKRK